MTPSPCGTSLVQATETRTMDVGQHDAATWCIGIGHDEDAVTDGLNRGIPLRRVAGHLYELCVVVAKVAHIEVVALIHAVLNEKHHGLVAVDAHIVEAQRIGGILIEQLIAACGVPSL